MNNNRTSEKCETMYFYADHVYKSGRVEGTTCSTKCVFDNQVLVMYMEEKSLFNF